MIQACQEAGVKLMYAEELCFAPKYVRAKRLVEEGALGKVYRVKQSEEHFGPHMPWFWDVNLSGGGVLMDMGCHSIEFCRWIYDKQPIESIYAELAKMALGRWDDLDDDRVTEAIERVRRREAGSVVDLAGLLSALYRHSEADGFPPALEPALLESVLDYRYGHDEPGFDTMCYGEIKAALFIINSCQIVVNFSLLFSCAQSFFKVLDCLIKFAFFSKCFSQIVICAGEVGA